MGLIKEMALIPIKLIGNALAQPPYMPPLVVGATELDTEGADDLWPEEPDLLQRECEWLGLPEEEDQVTRIQWGLRLPNGEVHWDLWQGISFFTPLDRVKMIATLQQTARDMGLNEGEQTAEFLNKYSWQTREQTSRIRYRNTESYALTDSEVSAAPREASNDHPHQGNSSHDLPSADSSTGLHPGFVGGIT